MLVLTRKKHETILIGETLITIVAIKGDKVRIAIDAPKAVKVLRGELVGREPKAKAKGGAA